MIVPAKLKDGDEVRVIAPSRSLSMISKETIDIATNALSSLGLKISFGRNVNECIDDFFSSSIKSRVEDIHDAFKDENVKGILTVIGGFNSNQLLSYLDYDLIKKNPKVLCGYSDITALQNAILAKTGLITYSGPHFSTFGMIKGIDYTIEYFKKCLFQSSSFEILPSKEWSDDAWFLDQENRRFYLNEGPKSITDGKVKGTIVGGNLSTFCLLKGTPYMPSLKQSILFIEDDNMVDELTSVEFERNFQSLLQLPDFSDVKGIALGRFPRACKMSEGIIKKIFSSKKELQNIPIVFDLDFSHTTPSFTFPIGGTTEIEVSKERSQIKII